jgi:putative ABC transport system ATP-binding protein
VTIELRHVKKDFGLGNGQRVVAAADISFTVDKGEFVALTGASGSGKSTLLHMIGAIERPGSGTIVSGGTEVTALRGAGLADYRRTVGFVFQRYNLLPALTALDNVLAPVLPYRTSWNKAERAREMLAAVGLGGRERSLPSRMSGGEQQRVAIARALINRPSLVLADEPTGSVDSRNAAEIIDLLARLRGDYQTTVLLATHDPQVAARCERLIRLRDGAVVDDIRLTEGYPVEDVVRRAGQLGLPARRGSLPGTLPWEASALCELPDGAGGDHGSEQRGDHAGDDRVIRPGHERARRRVQQAGALRPAGLPGDLGGGPD